MQENLTLEQQKKELQMTLSKFTHEIRNPVALIQSELQMLASAHPELNSYDAGTVSWKIWNISGSC